MEEGTTNNTIDRYAKHMTGSWCSQFLNGSNPWMARYVYGLMFLIATFLAWAVRDYGHSALKEMERLKGCGGGKECLGTEGVLRVSLGCFIFYFVMFLSTIGTSKLRTSRELWHSGWGSAKILLMIGLTVLAFFVPSAVIRFYGDVAHFGAGVFLVIQLISVISFITWIINLTNMLTNVGFVLQSHPCDVTCNCCICSIHSGNHFDVHLVFPRLILPS